VEPDRPQMTMWYLHIIWWITKVTNTHSEPACVILIAFPWRQWLHKCASMLHLYIRCLLEMCFFIQDKQDPFFWGQCGQSMKVTTHIYPVAKL